MFGDVGEVDCWMQICLNRLHLVTVITNMSLVEGSQVQSLGWDALFLDHHLYCIKLLFSDKEYSQNIIVFDLFKDSDAFLCIVLNKLFILFLGSGWRY